MGPVTILIVDRDADSRRMLAAAMELFGFAVREARDGVEALAQVWAAAPHAILMDLPGVDALETTRRLKADRATAAIPVLLLTPVPSRQACERALNAGADDFLPKPCDPDALATCLKHHLDNVARR